MATRTSVRSGVFEDLRRRLKHERGRLMRTVARTEEELATLEARGPGDIVDHAAADLEARILSRLEDQGRRELDEIDAARARLDAGTIAHKQVLFRSQARERSFRDGVHARWTIHRVARRRRRPGWRHLTAIDVERAFTDHFRGRRAARRRQPGY